MKLRVRAFAGSVLALLLGSPIVAQVPDEVADLDWCPGSKTCLAWSPLPSAAGYNLYRGQDGALSALADATADVCLVGTHLGPTSGSTLAAPPLPGGIQWFLVTGTNSFGEGSAGAGSAAPRVLNSTGPCPGAAGLVLNEIDYDQDGSDGAEFIEVFNAGSSARALAGVAVILVNGLNSAEYERIDLGNAAAELAPGAYLVVGSSPVLSSLPPGTPSVAFPLAANNIQNGAPDGVALFDTTTAELLDALSYEGSITAAVFDGAPGTWNLVEGNAATAADSSTADGSLVRSPNGTDTGDTAQDWIFVSTATPGTSNATP